MNSTLLKKAFELADSEDVEATHGGGGGADDIVDVSGLFLLIVTSRMTSSVCIRFVTACHATFSVLADIA